MWHPVWRFIRAAALASGCVGGSGLTGCSGWDSISAVNTLAPSVTRGKTADGPIRRIYMLRGLGDQVTSGGVDKIGSEISAADPSAVVRVGNWYNWREVARDAANHAGDSIVLIGYSMGAIGVAEVANALAHEGVATRVIGIDPMCAGPAVEKTPLIEAVNYFQNSCGLFSSGEMRNATNVRVADWPGPFNLFAHIMVPYRQDVGKLVVDTALQSLKSPTIAVR